MRNIFEKFFLLSFLLVNRTLKLSSASILPTRVLELERRSSINARVLLCVYFMMSLGPVVVAEEKWQEHRSSHFVIYFKEAPLDFIQTVEENAERYYEEITLNLGFTRYESWTWDQRAKIYIYNDQEDYVASSRQIQWSHGAAAVKEKTIRTFPSAHGFFDSTLPHELGHIIFREFVGFQADIPLWFEEGVAMYQEKAKRWGAQKVVQRAMAENKFISLPDLGRLRLNNNTPAERVDLFYAEAASVVYYLITEFNKSRFVSFCQELKEGQDFNNSLQAVYNRFKDVREFNDAWVKYLQK